MKRSDLWLILVAAISIAACGDNRNNPSDPSEGEGEGDDQEGEGEEEGEGQEGEGEGEVTLGSLTVTSAPMDGAQIILDGVATGKITPHTFDDLAVGRYTVELKLDRFIQAKIPMEVTLTSGKEDSTQPPSATAEIFLYRDLTGTWRRDNGEEWAITMEPRPEEYPFLCPDTEVIARGFNPAGRLCIEKDSLSLSLCKNHASECGEQFAEGTISDDGNTVDFTLTGAFGAGAAVHYSRVH